MKDRAAEDLERIQGEWSFLSYESDGQSFPRDQLSARLHIQGDRWTVVGGAEKMEGTFRLDPSTAPKRYQTTGSNGETWLGIYECEGSTLKWCWASPGKPRPERFETTPGSGQSIAVMRRLEP